jgi:cobalt-zinc-cadmium efflux system protein
LELLHDAPMNSHSSPGREPHPHGPGHDHEHAHGHLHPGALDALPGRYGRAFAIAIVLNTVFVAVEFAYGVFANSTALMADAGHNLSDVLGLALAWGAAILSRRTPSARFTYGLRSSSILSAMANAMLLFVACGAIALEAVQRLFTHPAVDGLTVIIVAGVGIVVNGLSAWLFAKGSQGDLNIRGAYLHMAADAAVSLGVVVAGVAMLYGGWYWLDPVISLVIVAVILMGTWGLLRESVRLALSAVPQHIDVAGVEAYLRQCAGVTEIHDLHIWAMSTTETAMTVHLVMPEGYPGDGYMDEIACALEERYALQHCTLQVEEGTTDHSCPLHAGIKAGADR